MASIFNKKEKRGKNIDMGSTAINDNSSVGTHQRAMRDSLFPFFAGVF